MTAISLADAWTQDSQPTLPTAASIKGYKVGRGTQPCEFCQEGTNRVILSTAEVYGVPDESDFRRRKVLAYVCPRCITVLARESRELDFEGEPA